jgi:pyruvate/2-oxoglutarate dehydrogenase complex dihydrolipoamide dehydrogenase (E3) component
LLGLRYTDYQTLATEWATTSPSAANEIFSVTAGAGVYLGQTPFSKPNAVAVEGRELRFNKAVIATGCRAVAPMRYDLERGGVEQERAVWVRGDHAAGPLRSKAFFSGFEVSRA